MAEQKMQVNVKTTPLQYIRTIYLSLAAVIGLICFIMGASGAVKLGLNVWFPSDDFGYYSPYGQSPCEMAVPDAKGMQQKLSAEETAKCNSRDEENRKKQQVNNFNRQVAESVALTLVGFPIWLLHFLLIQADWKRRKEV